MHKSFLFSFAILTAGFAFGQPTNNTRTSEYSFPLVGLASTETIGVNLINLASNPTAMTTTTGTTPAAASCTGSVSFINSAGTTIGTATTFTLAAGAVTSVNLPFSSSGLTSPRGLVRTVVSQTLTPNVPCQLSFTLNTFDTTTGVTHVFLTGSGVVEPFLPIAVSSPGR
jgi:hypothetical protein